MKGFDELSKKFKRLENNAKQMEGSQEVNFAELFPQDFMRQYTSFSDVQEMFDPIDIDTEKESLEDNQMLQELVRERTQFNDWQEMLEKAVAEYAKRQLFAGI
ncbi:hypothetical protein [Maridesulfovibrio bastinii]|uniref:hypothetical protein n=1 Tax=Maridesulfovibrio bastinii TaxID=47157 RepID=UPI00040BD023|nr:hypothetical protein [Maridesulfovibrio bastinii]